MQDRISYIDLLYLQTHLPPHLADIVVENLLPTYTHTHISVYISLYLHMYKVYSEDESRLQILLSSDGVSFLASSIFF